MILKFLYVVIELLLTGKLENTEKLKLTDHLYPVCMHANLSQVREDIQRHTNLRGDT